MPTPTFPASVILFDLDGTLVDTIPDLTHAVDQMLTLMGAAPAGADYVRIWIGNGMDTLIERALRHAQLSAEPDVMAQARRHFKQIYGRCFADNSCLYPHAVDCLTTLREMDLGLGIVTNKPLAFTEPLLDKLGIRSFFQAVLGGDSLPQRKPDPEPLYHAVKLIDPGACGAVFVGDSVNDIEAARHAGYPVICLPYGYNHGRDIRLDRPDALIESLAELPGLIQPLAGSSREVRHG